MIQSVPREGHQGETTEMQKSVLVSFPRIIEVDGIAVKVLGEGSRIAVQLGNDGAPMNTSKIWRQVAPQTSSKGERVPVKPSEAAYEEALKQLENAEQYELVKTDFGYKAESGNVRQEEMAVVYQFVFKPQNGKGEMLPPRMIEIPAI